MTRPFRARFILAVLIAVTPVLAAAQTKAIDPSRRPDPYASPLDTIMRTRLWTDVPEMKDFVTTTRPDPKSLDYAPLTGQDPVRPAPLNAAGVAALKAELESGGVANEARAKGLRDPALSATPGGAKPKAARHARKALAKKTATAD